MMKKRKPVSVANEPMGIVIATGNHGRVQPAPLVRAYYWFSDEESEASHPEDRGTP